MDGVLVPLRLLMESAKEFGSSIKGLMSYRREGFEVDEETLRNGPVKLREKLTDEETLRELVTLHTAHPEWKKFAPGLLQPFVSSSRRIGSDLTRELFPGFLRGYVELSRHGEVGPLTRGSRDFSHLGFFSYSHPNSDFHEHPDETVFNFGMQGKVRGMRVRRGNEMILLPENCLYVQTGDMSMEWSDGDVPDGNHDVKQEDPFRETAIYFYMPSVYDLVSEPYRGAGNPRVSIKHEEARNLYDEVRERHVMMGIV